MIMTAPKSSDWSHISGFSYVAIYLIFILAVQLFRLYIVYCVFCCIVLKKIYNNFLYITYICMCPYKNTFVRLMCPSNWLSRASCALFHNKLPCPFWKLGETLPRPGGNEETTSWRKLVIVINYQIWRTERCKNSSTMKILLKEMS